MSEALLLLAEPFLRESFIWKHIVIKAVMIKKDTDIAWIFDQEYFEHPQCLKMYKWKRGSK